VLGGAGAALDVALAYFDAWTSHDMDRAMGYVADDVVCEAPAGRLEGAAAFRGFMGPFSGIVTSARLVSAAGDAARALVLYDTTTVPVASAPGAEATRVRDGRIVWMRIVFDRLPFAQARAASGS
jgi:ketosteroid isomerase-like protein